MSDKVLTANRLTDGKPSGSVPMASGWNRSTVRWSPVMPKR